ncbi:hypothetical protein GCM10022419_112110 [Nonomuraea rosea]|uniref:Uncharacterized protein n=1 Tax=Nonomuraea rosea TaxID=638574 RepID=A0ABP6ZK20_9ACTN
MLVAERQAEPAQVAHPVRVEPFAQDVLTRADNAEHTSPYVRIREPNRSTRRAAGRSRNGERVRGTCHVTTFRLAEPRDARDPTAARAMSGAGVTLADTNGT